MRAVASALMLLIINVIGLALGPWITGLLSDALDTRFAAESMRYALLAVAAVVMPWAAAHYLVASRHIDIRLGGKLSTALIERRSDVAQVPVVVELRNVPLWKLLLLGAPIHHVITAVIPAQVIRQHATAAEPCAAPPPSDVEFAASARCSRPVRPSIRDRFCFSDHSARPP